MLSRYTVLPWEDADEYQAIVDRPHGRTRAAGTDRGAPGRGNRRHMWRKRRLRLAEAAAHRRGLDGTLSSHRETVKVALVHLDA